MFLGCSWSLGKIFVSDAAFSDLSYLVLDLDNRLWPATVTLQGQPCLARRQVQRRQGRCLVRSLGLDVDSLGCIEYLKSFKNHSEVIKGFRNVFGDAYK